MLKKQLLTEFYILLSTFIVTTLIYVGLFGKAVFVTATAAIPFYTTTLLVVKYLMLAGTSLVLYFTVGLVRQIQLKFKNIVSNTMLTVTSLILMFYIYSYIQLASSDGVVLDETGLTIYPPLSAIPQSSQNDLRGISILIKTLWTVEFFLLVVVLVTLIMTYRNRKGTKA